MDHNDQLMFYAGMALMGLTARNVPPGEAASLAWQYADFMIELKPRPDKDET